jgi:parallel beta-helix repeat protein
LNFVSAVDYTEWEYLDFHGGGKDASKASYCVYNADAENSSNSHFFSYCKFHDAESDGVSCRGNPWFFTRCEAYLNGRYGFRVYLSSVKMTACSAHDNDNTGIYGCSSESVFIGNLSYDNGKDGTGNGFENISLSDKSVVCGNTAFNNPGDGFQIDDLADGCVIINNAAVGNGAYGFDLQGKTIEPIAFFGYNLAAANTSGHYSEGADNTFANFANGNNVASTQTADELFETITDGSEDFTPETGSDLIDAGLGVQ